MATRPNPAAACLRTGMHWPMAWRKWVLRRGGALAREAAAILTDTTSGVDGGGRHDLAALGPVSSRR
jgi:hypothetical protein